MEMVDPAQGGGVFRMRIVEHPLRHIDPVSQDVGQQAGSIVGKIAPGTVADGLIGDLRRGPEKELPIKPGRLGRVRDETLLPGEVVPHGPGEDHVAELLLSEDRLLRLEVMRPAALLHAALQYLCMFSCGVYQDRPVFPAVQRGLFKIDVFARFQGCPGHGHMQMIWGGD
jgi:hypothetical protein